MRRPLVAGNWKMNGSQADSAALLDGILAGIGEVSNAEVAVCPPFILIPTVADKLAGTPVALGGQNLHYHVSGAYTGEVSAPMLRDFGCTYVIVGHSERRTYFQEADEIVARKFGAALEFGLIPILCVGETLEEREEGKTEDVVEAQLDEVLDSHGVGSFKSAVIAYEPIWAIGTGKTASPEQAQEVHAFIRGKLAGLDAGVAAQVRILYGGSMKPDNAQVLISQADIDGGLIGGASLKAEDFLAIAKAAN
ncbi:MAG: triose-phosphate isomerase [Gammaproteobacteria bacterium]|nr:MAG: triose-phosphate isomerase [Gammaproteobacteria bacterium]